MHHRRKVPYTYMTPEALRALRKGLGLTIEDASLIVGTTPITWSRWEGATSRSTTIPRSDLLVFQLFTGTHPSLTMVGKQSGVPHLHSLVREKLAAAPQPIAASA